MNVARDRDATSAADWGRGAVVSAWITIPHVTPIADLGHS